MHSHTVSYVSITEAHFTLELKKKQFQANQDEIRDAVMIEVRIFFAMNEFFNRFVESEFLKLVISGDYAFFYQVGFSQSQLSQ